MRWLSIIFALLLAFSVGAELENASVQDPVTDSVGLKQVVDVNGFSFNAVDAKGGAVVSRVKRDFVVSSNSRVLDVDFEHPIVQNIIFENLDENSALHIGIDVPKLSAGPEIEDLKRVFAIDPSRMDFEKATVTLTSMGTDLFKCALWNFEAQRCDGSWVKIRDDLVPGREYEIELTPNDPGFAEGVRTNMRAYATGGANPTVTAVVTDGEGIGIAGVTVNFTSSAGVMTPASGVTGSDGTVSSTQSGGALGNTITLSSTNLTNVTITTAASAALAANSPTIIWLDNRTQLVKTAVTSLNGVLVSTVTTPTYTAVAGGTVNNPATISMGYVTAHSAPNISESLIWHNTYQQSDSIRVDVATTTASPDFFLVLPRRPQYNMFAYATGGANPNVTVVVMDKNNTGVANATVNFTASSGSIPSSAVTGPDGTVTVSQTGGVVGDQINVTGTTNDGFILQPSSIVTAASPAVAASSRVIAWRPNQTEMIYAATVSQVLTSLNVLTTTGVVTSTNLDRTPFNNVALSSGSFVNQAVPAIGSIIIAPGTYGTDDVLLVNVGTTTPTNDQAIILDRHQLTKLETFATSGANPNVTAVVLDVFNRPVSGVNVSFLASAGTMTPSSAVTGPNGTVVSVQSGGALGNTINISTIYGNQTVTTSAAPAVAANDFTFGWIDPTDRSLHLATVNLANRTLTTGGVTAMTTNDESPDTPGILSITTVLAQTGTVEALAKVAQGTSVSGDLVTMTKTVTTPVVDSFITLPNDASQYLYAFAQGGANPLVTAVVTDASGNGISGVNVSFVSSAGIMTPSSALTNADGVATSLQSGGSIGDAIVVSSVNLTSTTITTAASAAVAAADYVYSWFEGSSNIARSATVTRANNVLASGTTTTFTAVDNSPTNNLTMTLGATTQQVTTDPAFVTVSNKGDGDVIEVNVLTTNAATDAVLTINSSVQNLSSSQTTLEAFATGGANPTVTAVVKDAFGIGIAGVTVNFTSSVGTMTPSSAVTGSDGSVSSVQSGGSLGNTITVSSANVSSAVITTANSVAVSAASFGVSWFDSVNADLKVATVSTNRVLNSGTITPTFTLFDVTPLNRVTLSVGLTQSQIAPNISITPVWRRSYGEGDQIFVEIATTSASPDAVITLRNNSNNSLFAYASSGANPVVTAVVTDWRGAGVPNVSVTFSSSAGVMTPSSGVTGIDGTVTSVQSGGVVGNVIVVNSSSQNFTIVTAVSPAVAASSRAAIWWDNSTNRVNAATVSQVAGSQGVLTTTGVVTPTNFDNTPLNNVTLSSGSIVSQATNIPGRMRLAQGTYGEDDILSVDIGTTTPIDGAIMLYENQRTFVDAFATSGANPTVTAFVRDLYGAPVSGVTVNFSSAAGTMTPASATTDHTGIVQSAQSGGALGDNISVVALDLKPVNITSAASVAIAAASPVYAIVDPSSRIVRVASVTESNNVLTTTSATTATTIQGSFSPRIFTLSTVVAQTTTAPSLIQIIPVSESPSDMITIAVGTTTPVTDAFFRLPQRSNRSLYAFASGGANPTVTAVVVNEDGVGVAGVPVSFTSSAGVMTPSSGSTNSSGMFSSTQSGGALGDTILVSSFGLTPVTITTAASAAIAAADVVFPWFDAEGSNVYTAAVTRANNVLTTSASSAYILTDNTPNNNASVRNITATSQTSTAPGSFLINRTTAGDGDFVTIATATTTQVMDGIVFINLSTTTEPNINITKTDFPDPVPNGSLLTYTITLNNTGGKTALNVTVEEIYAPNVTFVNATPAPNVSNNIWFIGNLSGLNSTSITIVVNVSDNASQGGSFNNTAIVNWSSPAGSNFTANVTINTTVGTEPFLVVSKSASPNPVFSGSQLVYQISIQNTGSANATNVTLIDVLPGGVAFVNASPSNFSNSSWSLPNISSGDTLLVNITVNVTALGGTNIVNTANVSYLNSSNGTVYVSTSANVSVLAPPVPPGPGGGGGGAGGAAGGGGGGGGGLPAGTFEKVLPEQTVSMISTLEVYRGEEIRFPLKVTNTFQNTVLNDVWIEVDGPLAQYFSWIPEKLNLIPFSKSAQFLVSLFAPNYATADSYEVKFLVHGVLEAEETVVKGGFPTLSIVKKPILIQHTVKLIVKDLSPQKQDDIMAEADALIKKLRDNDLPDFRALRIYDELALAVKANNGERVNFLLDSLRNLVNLGLEAKSDIEEVNDRIRGARMRGLDTREAERVLALAVGALDDGDFERAIRLAAQASEISFIELKGAFNLLNFFVRNWWILVVLSAVLSVGGASAYSSWFVRHVQTRLVELDDEEEILYDEMKKASEQAYLKKSISMSAYHRMLSDFEMHLEKIDSERSRLRIQRAKLFSVQEELSSIDHERKSLTEQVKILQESYYLKESLGANKYRKRENSLQRRLAHLDVDFELLKLRGRKR